MTKYVESYLGTMIISTMELSMKLGQALPFECDVVGLLQCFDLAAKKKKHDYDLQDCSNLFGSYLDEVKFMCKHVCC